MESTAIVGSKMLLELLVLVLVSGVVFGKLSEILHLPDVVLFIVAGIILGPYVLNLINVDKFPIGNQFILTFGAAYILYDGGREVELDVLNKVKYTVISLATIGVILSTFITGYFAYKILNIDFIYALLLGSVIASTDPSVLVPLFKNMNISNKLKQTIISESAFNDAAGAIITFSIITIIQGGSFSLGSSSLKLLITSIGGIAVGGIVGSLVSILITDNKYGFLKQYPSQMAIVGVGAAYLIGEELGVSGFMAAFIMGMICGNKGMAKLTLAEESYITHLRFKEVLTVILRMMIFILLGTHVQFNVLAEYWKPSLAIVFVLIFIARPISAFISIAIDRKAKWNLKEVLYMMSIRETGVIPAALAGMMITMKIPNAEIISSVTFMAIIITLTFQASTAHLLAKLLKLDKDASDVKSVA
ncbi:sodium:proton antiporter [Clostridium sp. MB40-C1]|uniref:cation:proton antiporter n=1 Tax=Clostridium sp. MB40-C1 TaxID=3070996 RepID=UPI0027DF6D79|nr:sodium:proton antiporter [Clostridium sp. MB40-C1]WMJ80739.1 sodium:proton antiporter [Clostridium sp. MB40-C1]